MYPVTVHGWLIVEFDGGLGRQEAAAKRDDPSEVMNVEARILKRKGGCVESYNLVRDYGGGKRKSLWEPSLLRGLSLYMQDENVLDSSASMMCHLPRIRAKER